MLVSSRRALCCAHNSMNLFMEGGTRSNMARCLRVQMSRGKVKKGRAESIAASSSGRCLYVGWDNKDVGLTVHDTYNPESSQKKARPATKHPDHPQPFKRSLISLEGGATRTHCLPRCPTVRPLSMLCAG